MSRGRKRRKLADIPQAGNGCFIFSDEIDDGINVENANLPLCHFDRVGLKSATITNTQLTQCLFSDVYLRLATFKEVNFTGSTFRNCNLSQATFSGCDFRYCQFEQTVLDPDEIQACLPSEPNLKLALARSLRKNFEGLGQKRVAERFLSHEIEAEEAELWARWKSATDYYRNKYATPDRYIALLKFCGLKALDTIWGHGYRIWRLLLSYFVTCFVLGCIAFGNGFQFETHGATRSLNFGESLYQACSETLGLSPFIPVSTGAFWIQFIERFLGVFLLATLTAATYRRISR